MGIKGYVTATAGDGVPAEVEYYDTKTGEMVGFWAYGSWHPNYPYQGNEENTIGQPYLTNKDE